jgi:hypothetical protein
VAKNTLRDLNDHLFETIEALKDPDNPMGIARALAVTRVADAIVKAAKVQLDYHKTVERLADEDMRFFESGQKRLINGKAGHA